MTTGLAATVCWGKQMTGQHKDLGHEFHPRYRPRFGLTKDLAVAEHKEDGRPYPEGGILELKIMSLSNSHVAKLQGTVGVWLSHEHTSVRCWMQIWMLAEATSVLEQKEAGISVGMIRFL